MPSDKVYSLGFNEELLFVSGNRLIYSFLGKLEVKVQLLCDLEKNELFLLETQDEGNPTIHLNCIIDLDHNGKRWEGSELAGLPFGFGRIFNSENGLLYRGYMFNGKKICFGTEFYEDGKTVEYIGNFMNDLRHGWGILYDKMSNKLFEGIWHFGSCSPELIISPNCNNQKLFTSCVKELTIGDGCYNDQKTFVIQRNDILENLIIGQNSFCNVGECIIRNCSKLKRIQIGANSFLTNSPFFGKTLLEIRGCEQLEDIEIGDYSFKEYKDCFELIGPACITFSLDVPCLKQLIIGCSCFFILETFELSSVIECSFSIDLPQLSTFATGPKSFYATSLILTSMIV